MQVQNASTDVTTYFVLRDSTNHAPKTDVTITDIDLYYCEQGAAMAAKVDATALAAADSAHADNKAYHVGQGLYRIDWPDTCFNGGVGKVTNLIVVCTGVDTTFLEVELTGVPQTGDAYARLGAPAGASVSADIADLPTVSEFEARTIAAADYTIVSDLPTVPSAADNATAVAAAILVTPANKLETDASGHVSISGTKTTLDDLSGTDGDTLKTLSDQIDGVGGAAGSGAITWVYTLTNSIDATAIPDAEVWVTSDAGGLTVLASGRTNASGQVTFYLDAGTVYVWRQKAGWNFTNPDSEVVV